ncbi:universal stress protein [Paenibacillus amylolyticus]|nr:universal stress protein [Paenibacillus amylolyticus]
MFDKIMVTIDKSEITNKLLDATVEIAQNKQAQVTLVNVSQDYVSNGMTYVPENFLEDILNEMEKESLEQLHQAKSKLKSRGST